ncbi:MAG: hypothetical protein JNM63_12785, partial [Spirochaetia bacterium]|nr:hypothetical protein [Spirochaetia bacterium]
MSSNEVFLLDAARSNPSWDWNGIRFIPDGEARKDFINRLNIRLMGYGKVRLTHPYENTVGRFIALNLILEGNSRIVMDKRETALREKHFYIVPGFPREVWNQGPVDKLYFQADIQHQHLLFFSEPVIYGLPTTRAEIEFAEAAIADKNILAIKSFLYLMLGKFFSANDERLIRKLEFYARHEI